jgi:hypothetical protein
MRLSEDEILKIAEVRKDIFQSKMKVKNIDDDQMALSIYFKMISKITNDELFLVNQLDKYEFSEQDLKSYLLKNSNQEECDSDLLLHFLVQ